MDENGTNSGGQIVNRLAELDGRGFLFPSGADPEECIATACRTLDWAETIRADLQSEGRVEIFGEEFTEDQLVPHEILSQCLRPVEKRYGVKPDWVPAFFSNRLLPWYVGGACFYLSDNKGVRVCFVLRNNFRTRQKWLLYSRTEIISHEICHVARSSMGQNVFEEPLAYRISESRLRRGLGPMFRDTWEALSILGASLLLMLGSAAGAFGAPQWIQYAASIPLIATCAFLGLRAFNTNKTLKKALENLQKVFGPNAEAVAFRCTDREIEELAGRDNGRELVEAYTNSAESNPRWAIIHHLFGEERPDGCK